MSDVPVVDERAAVLATARRARKAAVVLRGLTRAQKDDALRAMAAALRASSEKVLAANAVDVERARGAGFAAFLTKPIDVRRFDSVLREMLGRG